MGIYLSVTDALQRTNWSLFRQQKGTLVSLLNSDTLTPQQTAHLDGLLNWIDAVQDAAADAGVAVYEGRGK